MANLFTNAIDVTPGSTGVWVDIDVSADVPTDATGVILQIVNTVASARTWGLRKSGSTDARLLSAYNLTQTWGYIGVSNQIFQGYISGTGIQFKLLGYFTSDGVFFTNATLKDPTVGSWQTVDCSAEIPAGAKFAVVELTAKTGFGLRPTGSTDNRIQYINNHAFALVGLDANRTFAGYRGATYGHVNLIGYLTQGTFKVNGVDVGLASTGAYVSVDRSGDADATNGVGVLIEVQNAIDNETMAIEYALRKNGGTDDFYRKELHAWGVIGLDASKVFQGKIADLDTDFYIMGYLVSALPPSQTISVDAIASAEAFGTSQVFNFTQILSGIGGIISREVFGTPLTFNLTQIILDAGGISSVEIFGASLIFTLLQFISTAGGILSVDTFGNARVARIISVPYVLRYPSPQNGQTNVPVGNGIKFKVCSDGPGVAIGTVKVKITDSQGVNIYDSTSPYFKYAGTPASYLVEVSPPQPWAYEENVLVEIDAWDLAVPPIQGVVYEYVP